MRFARIGFREFVKDLLDHGYEIGINDMLQAYDSIKKPERQTIGSAGYDFRSPLDITIGPGQSAIVPTGIRAVFNEDEIGTWCLQLFVRSSVGHKDGVVISHGTGIIGCDKCGFGRWSSIHQTAACERHGYDPCFEDYSREHLSKRANFCPLVEVKEPHGKLIDASKLNMYDVSPVSGFCVIGVTEEDIELADAVIEAEGRNDES